MKLRAIKSVGYRHKGAIFEVSDRKAAALIRIGVAERVESPSASPGETVSAVVAIDTAKPKRTQYKDREMRPRP